MDIMRVFAWATCIFPDQFHRPKIPASSMGLSYSMLPVSHWYFEKSKELLPMSNTGLKEKAKRKINLHVEERRGRVI